MRDLTTNIRDNLLAALAACQAEGLPFKPTRFELEYMRRAKDWKLPTIDVSQEFREWKYVATLEAHGQFKSQASDHIEVGKRYIQTRDPYFLTLWSVP